MLSKPGGVFKSLETDREFIRRLRLSHPLYSTYYGGPGLDDEAWMIFKMQRRIVEREA